MTFTASVAAGKERPGSTPKVAALLSILAALALGCACVSFLHVAEKQRGLELSSHLQKERSALQATLVREDRIGRVGAALHEAHELDALLASPNSTILGDGLELGLADAEKKNATAIDSAISLGGEQFATHLKAEVEFSEFIQSRPLEMVVTDKAEATSMEQQTDQIQVRTAAAAAAERKENREQSDMGLWFAESASIGGLTSMWNSDVEKQEMPNTDPDDGAFHDDMLVNASSLVTTPVNSTVNSIVNLLDSNASNATDEQAQPADMIPLQDDELSAAGTDKNVLHTAFRHVFNDLAKYSDPAAPFELRGDW